MGEFLTEPKQTPTLGRRGPVGPPGRSRPVPRRATPSDGHEATAILDRARDVVDPELRRAVDSLPGAMRRIARYHFGWEHADGTPAIGNAGKAIRPALVLTAVRALGGREAVAVGAAAAVELVHNFTLLHDDVMDRDATRRHRPTVWTVFGDADAILAGDALQALALGMLAEDRHPAAAAAAARLAACVVELCAGQHDDTAMERSDPDEVTLGEVLDMAEAKTGALLGCACAVGALYAGADDEDVEALDAFGREAGLAFQLIDDVIGIWGDPGRTGKPAGADLMARKSRCPWSPRSPPAPRRRPTWPSCTGGPTGRGNWSARSSPSSRRAAVTGRNSRRPTGWAGRCTSCPVRFPIPRLRAVCWRWPSS